MSTKKTETNIATLLEKIGDETLATVAGPKKTKELMLRAMYKRAVQGDIRAAQFIADRLEGHVSQTVALSQPGGPVKIEIVNSIFKKNESK